jgi:hypothetical protein
MKLCTKIFSLGVAFLTAVISLTYGYAQGTFNRVITFDGPPIVPPGSGVAITYYYEDSMTFRPINSGEQFSRAGGGRTGFPENGSAYILQAFTYSLAGSRGGVSRFGLYSVDLSEFSTLYNYPWTVQFIGYRSDSTTVTTQFTTDGIIDGTGPAADFETFYFDSRFADLVRFEAPSYGYALDNFDVVPEPTTSTLLLLGGAGLWLFARRKNRTRRF